MLKSDAKRTMESALQKVGQLPTLPLVYTRLQNVLADPKVSAQQVGRVIEQDQSLASKILKIVNSAYYGFPRKISTLSQAVVILGFSEIKHLALSISIINTFGDHKSGSFDHVSFWQHSLAVAVCAGCIAKKKGNGFVNSHEEAFVAGLLHDIGKIVEDQYLHVIFSDAFEKCKSEGLLIVEAEKKFMGFTHQETGEYLAEMWRLPQQLVVVAGYHHSPLGKKSTQNLFVLLSLVHVADCMVRTVNLGSGGDPFVPPLVKECWDFLGISASTLDSIMEETYISFNEIAQLLPIDTSGNRKGI